MNILEAKQDKENFKKWIKDSNSWRGMSQGNLEAFVNSWFNDFETYRTSLKPPYNDYYYWIKLNDWDKFTEVIFTLNKNKEEKQKAKEGARLIYSDNDWKVYHITNYEASVKYGKGTKWCISGTKEWGDKSSGKTNWDKYTKRGIKFYFFINKDGHKWALSVLPYGDAIEITNDADMAVAYIPNAPIVDELKQYKYSIDSITDYDIILNGIINNKLPFNVFSQLVWDVFQSYIGESDFNVFDNIQDFINCIDDNIPDGVIEWDACSMGYLSEEEYKQITGEEMTSYWDGDVSQIPFEADYKTKENFLKHLLEEYNEYKYFVVTTGYGYYGEGDYWGEDNWTKLLFSISNWFNGGIGDENEYVKELKENFKTVAPQTVLFALMAYKIHDKNLLKQLGCSDEFINNIDNSMKEEYNILDHTYLKKGDTKLLFQDYLNNCLKDEELKKYYLEESLGENMKDENTLNEHYTINGKTFDNLKDYENYCAELIIKLVPSKKLTKDDIDSWEY